MRGRAGITACVLAAGALSLSACGEDGAGETASEHGDSEAIALEFVQRTAEGDLDGACDVATSELRYGPCDGAIENLADDAKRLEGAEVERSLEQGDVASVGLYADGGKTTLIIDLLLVEGEWKVHDFNATYE